MKTIKRIIVVVFVMKRGIFMRTKLLSLILSAVLLLTLPTSVSAASVTNQYGANDDYGGWKASYWTDTSTGTKYLDSYTDCWTKDFTTRYHEHVIMIVDRSVNRLTVTVQPKYYSTGANIGSRRRYDVYNTNINRVAPKSIDSGGSKVTLFATLESQYTTATLTYHNIYGV